MYPLHILTTLDLNRELNSIQIVILTIIINAYSISINIKAYAVIFGNSHPNELFYDSCLCLFDPHVYRSVTGQQAIIKINTSLYALFAIRY